MEGPICLSASLIVDALSLNLEGHVLSQVAVEVVRARALVCVCVGRG